MPLTGLPWLRHTRGCPGCWPAAGGRSRSSGVVGRDDVFILFTQNLLEIGITVPRSGRRRRGVAEPRVVAWYSTCRADRGVGGLERGDASQAQFIDEPVLQCAIEPLAAAAGSGAGAPICSIPKCARARPTCVRWVRSIGPPAFGVRNAQPARSVYRLMGRPNIRKHLRQSRHDGRHAFNGPDWFYPRRLVASSRTAITLCRWSGHSASQVWGLPSRCSSSPKQARGSRRRRCRPRARRVATSPAFCKAVFTNVRTGSPARRDARAGRKWRTLNPAYRSR